MIWNIIIHPLVLKEDLPGIDASHQKKILKTIRKKLGTNPEKFGTPLHGEYSRFRKLRVGEWRVIYSIKKKRVLVKVIKIGIRRNSKVYKSLAQRIPKILDGV